MKKRMSKIAFTFLCGAAAYGAFGRLRRAEKIAEGHGERGDPIRYFYAPQYAAIELGFFEEEGLELELSNGEGADKVMTRCAFRQRRYRLCRPRGLYLRLQ